MAKLTVCIFVFSNTGHSHRICSGVSFSAPHLLHEGDYSPHLVQNILQIILLTSQLEGGVFEKSILVLYLFWLTYHDRHTTLFTNSWKSTKNILIGFSVSVLPQHKKMCVIVLMVCSLYMRPSAGFPAQTSPRQCPATYLILKIHMFMHSQYHLGRKSPGPANNCIARLQSLYLHLHLCPHACFPY